MPNPFPNSTSDNVHYDPIPLHGGTNGSSSHGAYGEDITDSNNYHHQTPYDPYSNMPGSPSPMLRPSSPSAEGARASGYGSDFEPPRPGFMGTGGSEGPSIRDSIASSGYGTPGGAQSDYTGSVYALNEAYPGRSSTYGTPAYRDDPNAADEAGVAAGAALGGAAAAGSRQPLAEKQAIYGRPKNRRRLFVIAGGVAAALIILAVVIPVIFAVVKKGGKKDGDNGHGSDGSSSHGGPSASATPSGKPTVKAAITGGDGSEVTMEDGTKFTYRNPFGGFWYYDPEDPFNNAATVNSWTPPLNQSFKYGTDRIYGVNLGGWLNTEPFMIPALYERWYNTSTRAVDEWTLSVNLAADTANGGLNQLEDHYKTFITEKDFADIAAAGLNWVRIPIGWWAIEVRDNEPFLPKTSWTYLLKAIGWARKYGIRINLDLHAIPGSQNGWNHSGRLGNVNWLNGPMGYANAQRALDYIRIIAEFISQPQYRDVVPFFGILNEPRAQIVGTDSVKSFYLAAYDVVRKASPDGNGPVVSFHDAFLGLGEWAGFLQGAKDVAMDYHPYMCFQGQTSDTMAESTQKPCDQWASAIKNSMSNFGMTAAGEWSNAINDCGLYLNGVGLGTRYEGTYEYDGNWPRMGSCADWLNYPSWDADRKEAVKQFAMSTMDALQNWFFWNWKIGNSTETGLVGSPSWSYKLGLDEGWMPTDPRKAAGSCSGRTPFKGTLTTGSGTISNADRAQYPWPPVSITRGGAPTDLPAYTPTGSIVTLPGPTITVTSDKATSTVNAGNGWANPSDTAGMMVPVPSCSYLDPWVGPTAEVPSPLCSGSPVSPPPASTPTSRKRMERVVRAPMITSPAKA